MRNKIINIRLLLVLFLWLPLSVSAQLLSPSSRISILRGTPVEELYATSEHSAIRVNDPTLTMDWVFIYGTFDFDTPNFYRKFLRGKLDYTLSIAAFDRFKFGYYYGRQAATGQMINLNSVRKRLVFNFLMNNYRPENRYYKYDLFYGNCATTIRDLGIDLQLGQPADKVAYPDQYTYLPEFRMEAFANATITKNGTLKPLVRSSTVLIDDAVHGDSGFEALPLLTNWGLFIVILLISVYEFKRRNKYRGIDFVLFSIPGLIGGLIVF